jgi:hypothetical protein
LPIGSARAENNPHRNDLAIVTGDEADLFQI